MPTSLGSPIEINPSEAWAVIQKSARIAKNTGQVFESHERKHRYRIGQVLKSKIEIIRIDGNEAAWLGKREVIAAFSRFNAGGGRATARTLNSTVAKRQLIVALHPGIDWSADKQWIELTGKQPPQGAEGTPLNPNPQPAPPQRNQALAGPGPAISDRNAIVIGERFKLRAPIHERFGGTKYSGIAPSKLGYVLAFTSPIGNDHGYVDGWSEAGDRFFYAGQGQIGDQNFDSNDNNGRNNLALLNHRKHGRKLVVFKGLPNRIYECMGEFVCVGHEYVDGIGTDKQPRTVIKFELVPTVAKHGAEMDPEVSALLDGHGHEGKERLVTHRRRERDSTLARAAKAKHGNAPCTCCRKNPAEMYGHRLGFGMDAHHIEPLGSRDASTNTITRIEDLAIVCVLCHRALHTSRQDGSFPSIKDLQEHFAQSQ